MPSLQFGYSLIIGLTIGSLPLAATHCSRNLYLPLLGRVRMPSTRRAICLLVGSLYPFTILVAIVSTANHFILDAVAGACICGTSTFLKTVIRMGTRAFPTWKVSDGTETPSCSTSRLPPLENCFLPFVRIHKLQYPVAPESGTSQVESITLDEEKDGYRTASLQSQMRNGVGFWSTHIAPCEFCFCPLALAASTNFNYTRINGTESALLVVDIEDGHFQVVHDMEPRAFRNNIYTFSQLGVYFDLPMIITTDAERGPDGAVAPEILADHPKAPYIKRKGEVNA